MADQYWRLVEQSPDAIFIIRDLRITFLNRAAGIFAAWMRTTNRTGSCRCCGAAMRALPRGWRAATGFRNRAACPMLPGRRGAAVAQLFLHAMGYFGESFIRASCDVGGNLDVAALSGVSSCAAGYEGGG